MIDNSKIREFRNYINENKEYIFKTKISNGKNRWSIICSAMDWITIGVNRISDLDFSTRNIKDIDRFTTEVIFYISMIDIIFESIKQLHRVIVDRKTIPFSKDKSCFTNNSHLDDNSYFKHIRAIFGAHPVNLRDNNHEKWYASWPSFDSSNNKKYDLIVYLYPLDSEKNMKEFGIIIKELNCFLEKRFHYLDELKIELEKSIVGYLESNHDSIEYSGDIILDLKLAQKKLNEILPNDYLDYLMEKGIKFLEAYNKIPYKDSNIDIFMKEVLVACEDLKNAVLKLDFENKKSYEIFELKSNGLKYTCKKYISALENNNLTDLVFYKSAKKDLKNYNIDINKEILSEVQLLIIYGYLYIYNS